MKNYIKLLPAIMVIFNYGYSSQLVQQPAVVGNGAPIPAQVNSTIQQGAPQTIGPNQNSNFTGSLPGTSSTTTVNPVQPNNTTQQNLVQQRSNSMTTIQNNNIQQVQSNNMQYAKSKTITSQSNNAPIFNGQQPIPTAPMDNSTSVLTVNQQPQKLHKANTMQNKVVQNNQNVAPIKKTNTFTSTSNSEQNLKNTINRTTSLGVTSNSSEVLGNVPKIARKKTINTDTAKNINTEELALTAINANNIKLTEIANQENMENKNKYINNRLYTLEEQAEGRFLDIDRLKQNWAARDNYYSASNTKQITKDTIIIVDEQKRTILNNIYTIFDINIKEIQKSFSRTALGSDTNKMLIDRLTTFKNNVLAPLKDFKLGNNNISQVPSSTYNSNIQNSSMYNCLIEAKEHKKKQKKDKYTQELLSKLAEWFKILPQNKIAEQYNTANSGYDANVMYDSTALEEFIKDASTYYLKLPVLYKAK